MKKVLVSFADKKYEGSQKNLTRSAMKNGIDWFENYTPDSLKYSIHEREDIFYEKNKFILTQPRGAGYWLWKPYIILETLISLNEGDIVLYSDATVTVISDLSPLFELADKHSIVTFQIGGAHTNKVWTKRECFLLMGADEPKYHNYIQTTASYQLYKNDETSISFLKEYLHYCENPMILTDIRDPYTEQYSVFKDHRHDQSVLSILSVKHNLKRWRDPSQYGNEDMGIGSYYGRVTPESKYPQIFDHHRMKYFG